MNRKTRLVLFGVGGLTLLGSLFFLGTANAKPRSSSAKPEDDSDDAPDDTVRVIPPGPEGVPADGGAVVDVVVDEVEEEEPLTQEGTPDETVSESETILTTSTPAEPPVSSSTAAQIEEIAAIQTETGKSPEAIINEVVAEVIPEGIQPSPLAMAEDEPELDPYGTVALARLMLAREMAPGWKSDLKDLVAEWQRKRGLKDDGEFGVLSVEKMAEEVGILPLVRAWTLGKHWDTWSAKQDYDARIKGVMKRLESELPDSRSHIFALGESIKREQAQALKKDTPQPTGEQVQRINDALAAKAWDEGLENIA